MVYVATIIVVFGAVEAKATYAIGGLFTNYLLPISIMAILVRRNKNEQLQFFAVFCFGVASFLAWGLFDMSPVSIYFKYVSVTSIGVMYILGLSALGKVRDFAPNASRVLD